VTVTITTPTGAAVLQPWIDAGVFGPTEVHAAALVGDIAGSEASGGAGDVVLAFALAMWAPQHGHSCIDLDKVADIVAAEQAIAAADAGMDDGAPAPLPWPAPDAWVAALRASPAVREVSAVDSIAILDEHPLVLFGRRVYTQRQWVDECAVATAVRRRASRTVTPTLATPVLDRLLPPQVEGTANRQHAAARVASAALLTVVAGGPGTGKTHTVANLLAAELAGSPGLRVRLAAPTGKAASRLSEAVAATAELALGAGDLDGDMAARLGGLEATTVHRLLGWRPDSGTRFRHDAANPLDVDLLVVDETSMLALPLTARLVAALPDECRLVLVGDPDQLRSIEVGTVLADLVTAGQPGGQLAGHVVRLLRQHRTGTDSPIGPLAEAIRLGDADGVVDLLVSGADPRLRFVEIADGTDSAAGAGTDAVLEAVGPAYSAARDGALAEDPDAAYAAAGRARILCGHRRGPFGVATWNDVAEARVTGHDAGTERRAPAGRPLLATRNDPRTGLANGDPGVLVRVGTAQRAVFRRAGELVTFDLAELDAVETAYALTVHKSQGSEYDTVAVVHPPADSPLVSRELLYTAVTRTAARLVVVGSVESIRRAVLTPNRRVSGLADALTANRVPRIGHR
jgi:exodeoxyribonuclease V alpha subunit